MEPSVYGLILLIIFILIGSACCSGVEAAFLAVNSIRIIEIASKQKPKSSANQLLKLRKHLGRTLTVITITNNGFNIIGSLILGVTELIHGYAIAKNMEGTEEDIMNTIFPHPTISESMHEAVLSAYDIPIHYK